jgi:ABC-type sugar transport system ATPase subunit
MAKVILENVTKRFGKVTALDQVDLTIKDGEFFVLLGASGAGKSTTINVISGIEIADEGKVFLDEGEVTRAFPQDRNIATAFESYALYPHFTVYQNLMFPLEAPRRKRTYSKESREERVREVAAMLGIAELLQRYPRELSGGQKQRVALGRTLVRRPKAYLLDEPIAHLDAKLRHRMRAELKKIQREMGITTLYATPDQLEAMAMGDTVAVLHKGKIEQVGTPDEIYYKPSNLYVAEFVGDPPMNILPVDYRGEYAVVECDPPYQIPISNESQRLLTEKNVEHQLKVGLRPKDIKMVPASDPRAHAQGTVSLIDTLGQTSIVTVVFGKSEIKAKINSNDLPELHSKIGLEYDINSLYFFDATTGIRVC